MTNIPELYVNVEKGKRLFLQINRCSGCEYCIEICPRDILYRSDELNNKLTYPPLAKEDTDCTFCQLCEFVCPNYSIYVLEDVKA